MRIAEEMGEDGESGPRSSRSADRRPGRWSSPAVISLSAGRVLARDGRRGRGCRGAPLLACALLGRQRRRRGARAVRPRPRREPLRGVAAACSRARAAPAVSSGAGTRAASSRSLCWAGANLVPVECTPRGDRGVRRPRAAAGPAVLVDRRARRSGPAAVAAARAVLGPGPGRPRQPAADGDRRPAARAGRTPSCGRPPSRTARVVTPACVAMFTEEVGYSPVAADGGPLYNAQVAGLVRPAGRSSPHRGRPAGREVVFKAELGSVIPEGGPGAGRLGEPALPGPGPGGARHGGGRPDRPESRSPVRCRST